MVSVDARIALRHMWFPLSHGPRLESEGGGYRYVTLGSHCPTDLGLSRRVRDSATQHVIAHGAVRVYT